MVFVCPNDFSRVAVPPKRDGVGLIPTNNLLGPRLRRELDVVVRTITILVKRRADDQRRREAVHGANVRRVAKGDMPDQPAA